MRLFDEILKAEKRIRKHIRKTPLEFSPHLSELCGCNVYLKLESEQLTGSFKIRGAFNKILARNHEFRDGFITASTGNHGKAVGLVSKNQGLKAIVYVPKNVPRAKLEGLKIYGVTIRKYDGTSGQTETYARKMAEKQGLPFISPYNDIDIIAGQGTVGREIYQQLPGVRAVFVCIGGGGLISGVAGYLKRKNQSITIVGCEPKNSCAMSASIKAGRVIDVAHQPTLSDGSAGGVEAGSITFDFCRRFVDEYDQVSEKQIKNAIKFMVEKHHKIIEGAAAVPVASLIKNKKDFTGKNVVLVLSGSGIGMETLMEALNS